MMYEIRNVTPADLDAVTALEAACFPPEEAAARTAFTYRIAAFPERFFVAVTAGRIIGMVNGCASSLPSIEDRLFGPQGHEPEGKNQMIFGLAVDAAYRNQGVGGTLLEHMAAYAQGVGMEQVILTCKAEKLAFYARHGFESKGVSRSTHGGKVWYDMIRVL